MPPTAAAAGQWVGTAAVFGALYYKTFSKKEVQRSPKGAAPLTHPGPEGEGKAPPLPGGEEGLPLVGPGSKESDDSKA